MALLKNGVVNNLEFEFRDAANALLSSLTVTFYVISYAEDIDSGDKINPTPYTCTPKVGSPGVYQGIIPYSDSLLLSVPGRYRIVPLVSGAFRGGDTVYQTRYA